MIFNFSAEVLKIENPTRGDDTRSWGPPWALQLDPTRPTESAYFLAINRNKKSLTVNMKSSEGIAIIHKLVEKCDVLVENYVPGKLDELGLGYEALNKLNPRLVYASITGEFQKVGDSGKGWVMIEFADGPGRVRCDRVKSRCFLRILFNVCIETN